MIIELYVEMCDRFPEIVSRIHPGDAELPSMLMHHLAGWLKEMPAISPSVTKRVVEFCRWCEAQPRGEEASDDLLTNLVVSFYEPLFEFASTRALLPKLIPPEDLAANAEYLRRWVGSENYEEARKRYPRKTGGHPRHR